MRYHRTAIGTASPFDLTTVKDFMRVDGDDDNTGITALADTAAAEIEAYCAIALLTQTITATTDKWCGQSIMLPVGPVAAEASVTVHLIEQDGSATLVSDGYWLEAGRYPRIYFTGTPGAPLRITYTAGYGDTHAAIPADLSHAIKDHALKLYDLRGDVDAPATLSPAASRICARYRLVRL